MKKEVIILGRAPVRGKQGIDAAVDYPGKEVWTVGTSPMINAARYYEFHGITRHGHKMIRDVSDEVKETAKALPLNNSIGVMLIQAYVEGYDKITILGSPMIAKHEYIKQRAALAMLIGYVRGVSNGKVEVIWPDEPEKVNYFEAYQ